MTTMGWLYYGDAGEPVEIPDRLLAHVKAVIATKLRRSESFTLSWKHAEGSAEGRSTLWLQHSIPLRFVFTSPEPEVLDHELLRELADSANSAGGMLIDLTSHAAAEASAPALQMA
jgi:hypothetical protein